MTTEARTLDALIRLIEEVSGIVVPERDRPALATFARRRAAADREGRRDIEGWLRRLRLDRHGDEWRELLGSITVKESYLFRAPQQFEALTGRVVPEVVARRPGGRLRVWSAGCARGEEACTLAVSLAECDLLADEQWQVLATDVDERALEEASRATFGARAVAQVPGVLLDRHFRRLPGGRYELDPRLASRIEYRVQNLIARPLYLPEAPFDVIFLRNVLIYFGGASQRRVVEVVAQTLTPGGYLFLGPAETMWQLDSELTPVDLGDGFCYRREDAKPAAEEEAKGALRRDPKTAAPSAASQSPMDLVTRPVDEPAPPEPTCAQIIDALVAGDPMQAARWLDQALRRTPEEPLLRVLQGIACESCGDVSGAVQAFRAALYLNPMLFQARFLLARCMQRLGWDDRARRERQQVLGILDSPRAERLHGVRRLEVPDREAILAECRR
jgi:chemotaxis protein methyltransferase CheR